MQRKFSQNDKTVRKRQRKFRISRKENKNTHVRCVFTCMYLHFYVKNNIKHFLICT